MAPRVVVVWGHWSMPFTYNSIVGAKVKEGQTKAVMSTEYSQHR